MTRHISMVGSCPYVSTDSSDPVQVSFDSTSQGQLAMVIYEWADAPYLGKITSEEDDYLPVSTGYARSAAPNSEVHFAQQKTYVCTSDAVRGGFCSQSQLGRFILDLPEGTTINDTSFWSARVAFATAGGSTDSTDSTSELTANDDTTATSDTSDSSLWNAPGGNPVIPEGEGDVAWRRSLGAINERDTINPSPTSILTYQEPIQYLVRKTGYYCVGTSFFASYKLPSLVHPAS